MAECLTMKLSYFWKEHVYLGEVQIILKGPKDCIRTYIRTCPCGLAWNALYKPSSMVRYPLDRSNRFTHVSVPCGPAHSDTNSASLGSIHSHCNYCTKTIHSYISTAVYSQVLIYTLSELGHGGDYKIAQTFETGAMGIRAPDWESGVLPLSYRTPRMQDFYRVDSQYYMFSLHCVVFESLHWISTSQLEALVTWCCGSRELPRKQELVVDRGQLVFPRGKTSYPVTKASSWEAKTFKELKMDSM